MPANKYIPKRQHNTSIYNNRKIKPAMTGHGTIRQVESGNYVIIVEFEGWHYCHAIDCSNPIPFDSIKYYKTFKNAQFAMKKYLLNVLRRPHLKLPLYHTVKLHKNESRINW